MPTTIPCIFYSLAPVNSVRNEKLLKKFGKRLINLRKERKLSQSYLADLAGIPKSQVARIEKGTVNTTISTVAVLADALEMEMKDLLDI